MFYFINYFGIAFSFATLSQIYGFLFFKQFIRHLHFLKTIPDIILRAVALCFVLSAFEVYVIV